MRATQHVDVETRARQSRGTSAGAIYQMVGRALKRRSVGAGVVVDVGCGVGALRAEIATSFDRYIGVDVVRYEGLLPEVEFHQVDLDTGRTPLPDGVADVVVAVETIEHVENPRAFVRELVRLARPGGWILVTTPNQISVLSLLNLLTRKRFVAFRDENYPAHITALLPIDLLRMGGECGLVEMTIEYSERGRLPLLSFHYPNAVSRLCRSALSDNVLLVARKPSEQ